MSSILAPVTMEQAMAGRETGFANRGLVILNLILVVSQISSYATGYDGSMMSKCAIFLGIVTNSLIFNRRIAVLGHMASILQQPIAKHFRHIERNSKYWSTGRTSFLRSSLRQIWSCSYPSFWSFDHPHWDCVARRSTKQYTSIFFSQHLLPKLSC